VLQADDEAVGRAVGALTRAVEGRKDAGAKELLLLALAQQELKHPEQARPLYDRALKGLGQGPPDGAVALLLARALVQVEGLSAAEAEARLRARAEAHELAALTAAVEKSADKAPGHRDRATWYACRGRWKECAQDHLARVALMPQEASDWMAAPACWLLAGDVEEYRKVVERMAVPFRGTRDLHEVDVVSKVRALLPGRIDPGKPPLETLGKLLEQGVGPDWMIPYARVAQSLVSYRAGDFPGALRWNNQALERRLTEECRVQALLVRALAEHQLHRPAEAHQAYAEAAASMPPEVQLLGTADYRIKLPINSHNVNQDWLFAEVLRREAEGLLFPNLPAFLEGKHQPRDAGERLALAVACRARGHFRAAAGLYADAFSADPKSAEDHKAGRRYAAACCAARACAAVHTALPEESEQARLRGAALRWLKAEADAWTRQGERGTAEERAEVRQAAQRWQRDIDLARLRDPAALALLPLGERQEWTKLWASVAALGASVPEKAK
jgi:serine/threonine-protein kinase